METGLLCQPGSQPLGPWGHLWCEVMEAMKEHVGRPGSKTKRAEFELKPVTQDWGSLVGRIRGWEEIREPKQRPEGLW